MFLKDAGMLKHTYCLNIYISKQLFIFYQSECFVEVKAEPPFCFAHPQSGYLEQRKNSQALSIIPSHTHDWSYYAGQDQDAGRNPLLVQINKVYLQAGYFSCGPLGHRASGQINV